VGRGVVEAPAGESARQGPRGEPRGPAGGDIMGCVGGGGWTKTGLRAAGACPPPCWPPARRAPVCRRGCRGFSWPASRCCAPRGQRLLSDATTGTPPRPRMQCGTRVHESCARRCSVRLQHAARAGLTRPGKSKAERARGAHACSPGHVRGPSGGWST